LIFPEGETSRDGTVGEFKNGGFHLALHSGVPVLPIAIHGSYNILPSHSWIAHPRQVKVKISKPIYFNRMEKPGFSDISAACKKVRESILKMHSELANLG
jgi:1-acyl-sn-glycerol-3-phosphate acyltransferase